MNCRQCGAPIPNYLLDYDVFECPECGRRYSRRAPGQSQQRTPQRTSQRPAQRPQSRSRAQARPARGGRSTAVGSSGGILSFVKSRNLLLLIALVVALLYTIFTFTTIDKGMNAAPSDSQSAEEVGYAIGSAIGSAMLLPHAMLMVAGLVFNALAWFMGLRWAALVAAIVYTVSGVIGFSGFIIILVPMVLCYVAYAKMKRT